MVRQIIIFTIIGAVMTIIGFGLFFAVTRTTDNWEQGTIQHQYSPQDFKENYRIDLKQDGYLILDTEGEVFYVPFGQLEEWFLEMNL